MQVGKTYNSASEITGPSGWYYINTNEGGVPVYVNQDYDGGGWVCVMANRRYTAGMNNLTYNNAVNRANYRTGGSDDATNTLVQATYNLTTYSLADLNIFIGLKYWSSLAGRESSGNVTIVQFSAGTNGTALNATGSHQQRYRWRFSSFTGNYAFQSVTGISDETGTGSPGFVSMASSGRGLSTYDYDQDTNGGSCSSYYNNNPYWYTSCWSGNMFAGGGYIDGPYWTSSSSGYSRQYMALYIK
jgi:hypothetical protein